MTNITAHAPGTFCWIELATSDAAGARAFYTELFGWTVREVPMGEQGTYHMFLKGGREVGAMYEVGGGEMPPNWTSYINVSDIDASMDTVKSLGGTVHMGPLDVMEFGRMAVVSDPQGAMFALWQARSHAGVGVRDEPGALCWNELQARDLASSKKFYTSLFGWRMKETDEYTEWSASDRAIGGMIANQGPPEAPPHWMPYFAVEDCDSAAQQAESLGGTIYAPPFDVPNVGRMAVIADPQHAVFAIIRLNN
jgi:predicted enzyme related to lactoylglutathione lyase